MKAYCAVTLVSCFVLTLLCSSGCNKGGKGNWDAVLDDYEKTIDQMIVMQRKAKTGDKSALAEMASLTQTYQDLNAKLENAKNEMSESQVKRFLKILEKRDINRAIDEWWKGVRTGSGTLDPDDL